MRRLRIVSNGQVFGTKVLDAETGEDLRNSFTAARIAIDASNGFVPRLYLETDDFALDLVGEEQPPRSDGCGGEGWVYVQREDSVSIPDASEAIARDFMAALRREQQGEA